MSTPQNKRSAAECRADAGLRTESGGVPEAAHAVGRLGEALVLVVVAGLADVLDAGRRAQQTGQVGEHRDEGLVLESLPAGERQVVVAHLDGTGVELLSLVGALGAGDVPGVLRQTEDLLAAEPLVDRRLLLGQLAEHDQEHGRHRLRRVEEAEDRSGLVLLEQARLLQPPEQLVRPQRQPGKELGVRVKRSAHVTSQGSSKAHTDPTRSKTSRQTKNTAEAVFTQRVLLLSNSVSAFSFSSAIL